MIKIKRLLLILLVLSPFFKVNILLAQKINQLDVNKKRHGIWKKTHSNGRIRYIGTFNHGKEVGTFKFYDITTSKFPISIKKFDNQTDTVQVFFYTLKNKLRSKGKMIGKRRVGKWIYYFPNGTLFSEEFYINGKLDGTLKNYYKNQKTLEETEYKNGLKNGVSKKYSDKGILIEQVTYIDGKENGEAKYFDLKGSLKEKGKYKNGNRIGKWEYYMDGEIITDKEKKKLNQFKKNKK